MPKSKKTEIPIRILILSAVAVFGTTLAQASDADLIKQYCSSGKGHVFHARTTGYYPHGGPHSMEGGFVDQSGKKLRTLQDYLDGQVSYVSMAADVHLYRYGTKVFVPAIDAKYGMSKPIQFRVVDNGGAFNGRGGAHVDICVDSRKETFEIDSSHKRYTMIACSN